MTDLTALEPLDADEQARSDELLGRIVHSFARLGIQCVICVSGRGYERTVTEAQDIDDAPFLLERCRNSYLNAKRQQAN